jgi:hypothetical protein
MRALPLRERTDLRLISERVLALRATPVLPAPAHA